MDNLYKTIYRNDWSSIIELYKKSDKIIDMHMHSCYSDGELSPNEIIRLAILKNIGVLSITDHNTLEGIKSIDKKSPLIVESGIGIVNGIELSAQVDKGIMHILGYNMDINDQYLNERLLEFKKYNYNYFISLLKCLSDTYHIQFSNEEVNSLLNSKRNLGRPDIAILCVKHGYVSTVGEAFDKYLVPIYEQVRNRNRLFTYDECLDMILSSGGIPILAHPKTLELGEKELLILIKKLIDRGLKGIEVFHSIHTKEDIKMFLNIARRYKLLISGGSDFHGCLVKPDIEIGTGKHNNLNIKKLTLLDNIGIKR